MLQKNILLISAVLIALIAGISIGMGIYYYFFPCSSLSWQNQNNGESAKNTAEEAARKAQAEKEANEAFPDFVEGTLVISAAGSTITTADGKEYLLWPIYSPEYYTNGGLSNNQQVKLQGKIMPKDDKVKKDRLFLRPPGTY